MNKERNHPFNVDTRTVSCNVTKLNSIIDANSTGGIHEWYYETGLTKRGLANDASNWSQTLKIAESMTSPSVGMPDFIPLGSLVFGSGGKTIKVLLQLEARLNNGDKVSTIMDFRGDSHRTVVIVFTIGAEVVISPLRIVSLLASISGILTNQPFLSSSSSSSLYSEMIAITQAWSAIRKTTDYVRLNSEGLSELRQQFRYHSDVPVQGVGSFILQQGSYPYTFKN